MANLKNVKVGDLVLLHTWCGSFRTTHDYKVCKVSKVNKTTFKIEERPNKTFNFFGSVYGGEGWDRMNIIPYDKDFYETHLAQKAQEERKRELLNIVRGTQFEYLTNEQLEEICKIINEDKLGETA